MSWFPYKPCPVCGQGVLVYYDVHQRMVFPTHTRRSGRAFVTCAGSGVTVAVPVLKRPVRGPVHVPSPDRPPVFTATGRWLYCLALLAVLALIVIGGLPQ